MEYREVVRRRRMVRRFTDRPVEPELITELAELLLRAPSAGFTQGVSAVVLDTPEGHDAFWSAVGVPPGERRDGLATAPVTILVWTSQDAYLDRYARPDKGWTERDPARWSAPYWWVDAGMASLLVLLGAVDCGLAAVFYGVPPEAIRPVREAFGVPDNQLHVGVIALGYADPGERQSGSPRYRIRKRAEELIHRGRWTPSA